MVKKKKKSISSSLIGDPSRYLIANNPPPRSTRNSSRSAFSDRGNGLQRKSRPGSGRTKSVVSQ